MNHIMTSEIMTELGSVVLRLLKEEDAEELFLRVEESREHLRSWVPWLDATKIPWLDHRK